MNKAILIFQLLRGVVTEKLYPVCTLTPLKNNSVIYQFENIGDPTEQKKNRRNYKEEQTYLTGSNDLKKYDIGHARESSSMPLEKKEMETKDRKRNSTEENAKKRDERPRFP